MAECEGRDPSLKSASVRRRFGHISEIKEAGALRPEERQPKVCAQSNHGSVRGAQIAFAKKHRLLGHMN
jgi:hypothetical protein